MFMKSFLNGKICLTLEIIKRIQSFSMRQIKKSLVEIDEFSGVIVDEFVGLKSKIYSIKELMVQNQIPLKG